MPTYRTQLGHAHLKVRNLERSLAFYTRYFDLSVVEQVGNVFAFLSGGSVHHELALQAHGLSMPDANPYAVGLYHIAFEVPDAQAFAQAYKSLRDDGVPVQAVDHGISRTYFPDPDGNGLEIYYDTRSAATGTPIWAGRSLPLTDEEILAPIEEA